MKKRILTCLVSLVLLLVLLPTAAMAAEVTVKIGDVALENGAYYVPDADKVVAKVDTAPKDGGYLYYNNGTLTVEGEVVLAETEQSLTLINVLSGKLVITGDKGSKLALQASGIAVNVGSDDSGSAEVCLDKAVDFKAVARLNAVQLMGESSFITADKYCGEIGFEQVGNSPVIFGGSGKLLLNTTGGITIDAIGSAPCVITNIAELTSDNIIIDAPNAGGFIIAQTRVRLTAPAGDLSLSMAGMGDAVIKSRDIKLTAPNGEITVETSGNDRVGALLGEEHWKSVDNPDEYNNAKVVIDSAKGCYLRNQNGAMVINGDLTVNNCENFQIRCGGFAVNGSLNLRNCYNVDIDVDTENTPAVTGYVKSENCRYVYLESQFIAVGGDLTIKDCDQFIVYGYGQAPAVTGANGIVAENCGRLMAYAEDYMVAQKANLKNCGLADIKSLGYNAAALGNLNAENCGKVLVEGDFAALFGDATAKNCTVISLINNTAQQNTCTKLEATDCGRVNAMNKGSGLVGNIQETGSKIVTVFNDDKYSATAYGKELKILPPHIDGGVIIMDLPYDLDFRSVDSDLGDLAEDGYHWDNTTKTLSLENVWLTDALLLPKNQQVKIIVKGTVIVDSIQVENNDYSDLLTISGEKDVVFIVDDTIDTQNGGLTLDTLQNHIGLASQGGDQTYLTLANTDSQIGGISWLSADGVIVKNSNAVVGFSGMSLFGDSYGELYCKYIEMDDNSVLELRSCTLDCKTAGGADGLKAYLPKNGGYTIGYDDMLRADTILDKDNHFVTNIILKKQSKDNGGGGGSVTKYPPVIVNPDHGKITVDNNRPASGQKVTITIKADEGYTAESVSVIDGDKKTVELTKNDDGTYSFVQPSSIVTVTGKVSSGSAYGDCPRDKTCPLAKFDDMNLKAWYHDGCHYCVEKGLMNGVSDKLFAPNAATSRSMIVTILWRMEGCPVVNYAMNFSDVESEQWYTEAVRWAASEKIVNGYSNSAFGSDDNIIREQLAAIMFRYAQYKNYDTTQGGMAIHEFDDYASISQYAVPAMAWCVNTGLMNGMGDNTLNPGGSATRAEAAAILMRFCQSFANESGGR